MKDLVLKGKTIVFIDWANVYGWRNVLREEFNLGFFPNLRVKYPNIESLRLYFGEDTTTGSRNFIQSAHNLGLTIITKPVKYINIGSGKNPVYRRKCDMDLEIALDAISYIDKYKTFVFFSGDGDFKTLYERILADRDKKVVVVSASKRIGGELFTLKKRLGIFLLKRSPQELLQERG